MRELVEVLSTLGLEGVETYIQSGNAVFQSDTSDLLVLSEQIGNAIGASHGFTPQVARELLTRLKELLVLNWRKKSAARSQLRLAIEDALDVGLPEAYAPELYKQKCSAVFEHVYESYPERGVGVYAESA